MSNPTWVPCVRRREIELIHKDGSRGQLQRCAHQACSRFNMDVNAADCAACPLRLITEDVRPEGYTELPIYKRDYKEPAIRSDGVLAYTKCNATPPSVPAGYVRASDDPKTDDYWVFLPQFPSCVDREMANTVQRCGCVQINALCASDKSGRRNQPVTPLVCEACPVRRLLTIT
jgi:hypothetical protein